MLGKCKVTQGKPPGSDPEKNQGMRVFLDLTVGLCGHHVICDSFFTFYILGEEQLKIKLTMLGTIRKIKHARVSKKAH